MIDAGGAGREPAPLLEMIGIVKQFTGTLALDGVDLDVRPGEIHALLGQNGAGKSTLIKVLAGVYPASAGTIRWRGAEVTGSVASLPIAFIHQDLGLVDTMTVAENVALMTGYPRRGGLIDWAAASKAATDALEMMASRIDPERPVNSLQAADKSIVAIARALALQKDVIVLDEPTAALPVNDVDLLLEKLQLLRARGIGMLYVTHRLDEVFRIADRVTVLRDGRKISTRAIADVTPEDVVTQIVGGALAGTAAPITTESNRTVLAVRDVVVPQEGGVGLVGPVSLSVGAGDVLGLVGLRGAGHHALGRAIFGALPVFSGSMTLNGEPFAATSPGEGIARRVGFVSSRRAEESLAGNLSVLENLYLNSGARGIAPYRPVGRLSEFAAAKRALARFSVRPADPRRPIATLSGGNQQKVVVARWMEANIDLLILEEPTIGVDVGSKAEIYGDLRTAGEHGMAIILISSDFEEVEKICNRAIVFNRGAVVREVGRDEINVSRLTALASGPANRQENAA